MSMQKKIYKPLEVNHSSRGISDMEVRKGSNHDCACQEKVPCKNGWALDGGSGLTQQGTGTGSQPQQKKAQMSKVTMSVQLQDGSAVVRGAATP